jgi:DNA-binding NarL/FixJ family response regulator
MGMADVVRVLVVDDSQSTRMMLREALSLDATIEVVGEAGSGREAVDQAATIRPDVVLMDVRMPNGDGAEACRKITESDPQTKVVALTWSDDPSTVRDMLTAGAIGYVVKGGTIDELVEAIHRAHEGEPELDQRVLPAAVEDLRRLLEEERERRQEVERLAESRAEFIQVLSHELRTPLTVILGALRMLQRAVSSSDDTMLVESAVRRAGELEFLVEGLELVATGAPTEGPGHPRRAVQMAVHRLGTEPDAQSVPDEEWVGVSDRYLHRVAHELLSNAFRHGSRPVTVSASQGGDHGVLAVTDAGGWAPPDQAFAAFFQEDMSATRSRGGLGLGLFLASRLCQACGGGLTIRAEGRQTVAEARFRLRWPAEKAITGPE